MSGSEGYDWGLTDGEAGLEGDHWGYNRRREPGKCSCSLGRNRGDVKTVGSALS